MHFGMDNEDLRMCSCFVKLSLREKHQIWARISAHNVRKREDRAPSNLEGFSGTLDKWVVLYLKHLVKSVSCSLQCRQFHFIQTTEEVLKQNIVSEILGFWQSIWISSPSWHYLQAQKEGEDRKLSPSSLSRVKTVLKLFSFSEDETSFAHHQ